AATARYGGSRADAFSSCMGQIDAAAGRHHRSLRCELRAPRRAANGVGTRGFSVDISIFGLGYVGAVSLACLARDGHRIVGVDVDQAKLGLIAAGKTPVVEEGMVQLMQDVVASGRVTV